MKIIAAIFFSLLFNQAVASEICISPDQTTTVVIHTGGRGISQIDIFKYGQLVIRDSGNTDFGRSGFWESHCHVQGSTYHGSQLSFGGCSAILDSPAKNIWIKDSDEHYDLKTFTCEEFASQ